MGNLISTIKLILFVVVSYASIMTLVEFITGWKKKDQTKKLLGVTFVIWVLIIVLLNLIGRW